MAADLRQIVLDIGAFYDFGDRVVVLAGAGGGRLVEYARPARRVIAIDRDQGALDQLAARLAEAGMAEKFTLVNGDFYDQESRGDVVVFEFCLHEIEDPARALAHAHALAPDVVVVDHARDSRWIWYAAEDELVDAAWGAVERGAVRRSRDHDSIQSFDDHAELAEKLAAQGEVSRERLAELRGQTALRIPMPYRLALV